MRTTGSRRSPGVPWPTIWWPVAGAIVALAGLGFGLWWWMPPDFDGIAAYVKLDMQSFQREEHQVPIEVVADDDRGVWERERGAWLFLLQESASSP